MITRIINARLVLPDRVVEEGALWFDAGRIIAPAAKADHTIDAAGQYLAPGFVDMHVHGGAGADFMDATAQAFETAIAAHARHGTTTIVPTSTVARHEQTMAFLKLVREFKARGPCPARVAGAHLYGPYFAQEKVGCHPHEARPPRREEYLQYLEFADAMCVATCAPELDGAPDFYRDAAARGIRLNAGHSNASWTEMQRAFELGVRHVDHLYCAMSSVVSLRSRFGTPMQASMLEFVLANPQMTTELIADGRHLSAELLRFAVAMKGADKVALVTDSSRAMDMPPGQYMFGPGDGGEPFYHDGEVGLTLDRASLASSAKGMDHMVRHMHKVAGLDVATAVRMATLTPARILGLDSEVGSLEAGKFADLVILDEAIDVRDVYVAGRRLIRG